MNDKVIKDPGKIELLAPAGNLEKLKFAVYFGADAVYLGGQDFSLRVRSQNFTEEELAEGLAFAHERGKKVYFTLNIFAHNEDIQQIPEYLHHLREMGVDALIISDPGVFRLARKHIPEIPLHLSTQANTTNWQSILFWQELGLERIILARELTLAEIQQISAKTEIQLEAFVHGAMCMSYSGRCLLSNFMTGRDANRGDCAQSCRWEYALMEKKERDGEFYPVEEDSRGTYFFNSRDLNLIDHIPELIQAGVSSFKIEGRMKSIFYVATIVRAYREAIDLYLQNFGNLQHSYVINPAHNGVSWHNYANGKLRQELEMISHRGYTTGFLFDRQGKDAINQESASYIRKAEFLGKVLDWKEGRALIEVRGKFSLGDEIEIMAPGISDDQTITIDRLTDENSLPLTFTKPNTQVWINCPLPVTPTSLVRKEKVHT